MFALVLAEHAAERVDVLHAMRLLLVHDIVEIDAGDAPIHSSTADKEGLKMAEMNAAKRIFGCCQWGRASKWKRFGLNLRRPGRPLLGSPKRWIGYSRSCSMS